MSFKYKILNINTKEHWITIISDDKFDHYEPDAFYSFLKIIKDDVNGIIVDMQFSIKNDGIDLIYQWDSCFGITVIYPSKITEKQAVDFLNKYICEF